MKNEEYVKIMAQEKKVFLDSCTTSYIIKLYRNASRKYQYAGWLENDRYPDNNIIEVVWPNHGKYTFTDDELKAYLSTRPHVMNKKESKEARKLRKKSGEKRK
jgi:hypothetical protein